MNAADVSEPLAELSETQWEMCHNASQMGRPIHASFETFRIFFYKASCFWNETEVLSITIWIGNLSLNRHIRFPKTCAVRSPL